MKLHEAVGKRILEYCEDRKITPNKLCTMSGVIQSTINCIFSGKSQNPKLMTIRYLCDGLGITLKEFFDCPLFDDMEDWFLSYKTIFVLHKSILLCLTTY